MAKKKLLIYAHYYIPDTASTGQILRELAEGMLDKFDITVICVVPSYLGTIEDKYKTQKYYEEEINGVKVLRIRVPEFSKTNKKSRVKNIVSYFFGAMGATFKVGKMDYVFSISQPPILGGLLGVWGKWMKHAKYIYNIQDFNPEQVLAVGYTKSKLVTDAMMWFDKFSCKRSDLVITVGRDLVETVENRFRGKKVPKTVMINNWIDENEIYPLDENNERVVAFKKKYGLDGKFVIMYSFSTDSTEALCKELNAELQKIGSRLDFYQNKWVSYADQLNWGLQNTDIDTEWSMRMDADEEIMEDLTAEINEKLPQIKTPVNGVILRRRVYFMGRWIKHGGRYPELLLRIFRTGMASCEMKIMDEHMILSEGMTVEFKHDLIDNNQKDLEWWTAKHNWYSNREVLDHQMTLEKAMDESLEQDGTSSGQAKMKRVVKNSGYYRLPKFFRAHLYFIYRYYIKLGFLDGPEGKIFHFLQAYWYRFLVDAKIYECEKKGITMKPQGDLKA